jgi:broad specificity phosphatase PhoE
MGKIVIVRHGTTKLNKGGGSTERVRGWQDVDLDEKGRQDAKRAGLELKKHNIITIYSSPLKRAYETAQSIADNTKAPLHVKVELLPWQLGWMTNQCVKDIIDVMNQHVKNEDVPPKGGEPFSAYRTRFLTFLKDKLKEAAALPEDQVIALVSHSRGVQVTKAWAKAGFPDDLHINYEAMCDYLDETPPGGHLWIDPHVK